MSIRPLLNIFAVMALLLAGTGAGAQEFVIADRVIAAVPDRPVAFTVQPPPRGVGPGSIDASVNDQPVAARLWRIAAQADALTALRGPGWVPRPPSWRLLGRDETLPPDAQELWLVTIELPTEPGEIIIGDTAVSATWLGPRFARGAALSGPWSAAPPPRQATAALLPLQADPGGHWRRLLALGELGDRAAHDRPDPGLPEPIATAAAHRADVWAAALRRAEAVAPQRAAALRRALVQPVTFPDGQTRPVFALGGRTLEDLRTALLTGSSQSAKLAIEQALQNAPSLVAWMIDDGGPLDNQGLRLVTFGAAVLGPEPSTALAQQLGTAGVRQAEVLPPGQAATLTAGVRPLPDPDPLRPERPAPLRVTAAGQTQELAPITVMPPARPPGMPLGPLLHDWTMASWLSGIDALQALPPENARCAALLHRGVVRTQRGAGPQVSSSRPVWTLYIECLRPPRPPGGGVEPRDAPLDSVTVWLADGIALRVDERGAVRAESGPTPASLGIPSRLPVSDDGERWSVSLPVPDAVIETETLNEEPRPVLRVGLVRTDALGRRTAWPRRMLPDQREPSRLAIDLGGWMQIDR